jgi:alkanesulfonate monooxygenase SsuD/methylene tetrahydromethanopterin reductase-like flavin-dependent oxidoreductase (luciferase family)
MTVELGRFGIWRRASTLPPGLAAEVEALGYGAIWIGGSPGDLQLAQDLLDATSRIAVATGIVNIWAVPAEEAAASYHRIVERHPNRFLLGVGIGHPEATRTTCCGWDPLSRTSPVAAVTGSSMPSWRMGTRTR